MLSLSWQNIFLTLCTFWIKIILAARGVVSAVGNPDH
jgi:hypothetical protein